MLGNLLDVESSMRGEEGHSSGQVKYEATGYSRTFPGFTLWLKNAICCQKRAGFSSRWHFWYTCGKWWFLSNSLFSFPSLLCHTICLDISFLPYMQLYMWQNFQPIPNTPVTGIHVPYLMDYDYFYHASEQIQIIVQSSWNRDMFAFIQQDFIRARLVHVYVTPLTKH